MSLPTGVPADRRWARSAIAAAAAVVLIVGACVGWMRWRAGTPPSISRAVTVRPFENRTGDKALDPVGQMAADAIAQTLPNLESPARPSPPARAYAVVTGAYYLDGPNLRIQASLADTAGLVLHAMEPATGPRSDPGKLMDLTRQRMLGAIVTLLDPTYLPGRTSRPPLFNAYRELSAGLDLFGTDYPGAIEHFEKASQLDPDFFAPLMNMALSYGNMGDRARQREVLTRIAPMRDRMSRFERLMFDWSTQAAEGRQWDALETLRQAEQIEPDNVVVNYLIGFFALRLNRPKETLDTYKQISPELWNAVPAGAWRYSHLTTANHVLGRHEEELTVARTARQHFPSALPVRGDELYALVALGRLDEMRRAAEEAATLAATAAATPGMTLRAAAEELRRHGHPTESIDMASRAVAWYRSRPFEVQERENSRASLAQSLYVAERWTDAQHVVLRLLKEHPDNRTYVGLAGALAARAGDLAGAMKHSESLSTMPADDGLAPLWRAQIAALIGARDQAMSFLRDALASGLSFSLALHRNMDLESLVGWPPFDELMKPKG